MPVTSNNRASSGVISNKSYVQYEQGNTSTKIFCWVLNLYQDINDLLRLTC